MRKLRRIAATAFACVISALIAALAVPTCLLAGALTLIWHGADRVLRWIGDM